MAFQCLGTCSSLLVRHTRLSIIYGPIYVICLPVCSPTICHQWRQTAGSSLYPTPNTLFFVLFFCFCICPLSFCVPSPANPYWIFKAQVSHHCFLNLNLPGWATFPLRLLPPCAVHFCQYTLPSHCCKILSENITPCKILLGKDHILSLSPARSKGSGTWQAPNECLLNKGPNQPHYNQTMYYSNRALWIANKYLVQNAVEQV